MSESPLSRNIEHDQEIVEPTVLREAPAASAVEATLHPAPAANDATLRRSHRRTRAIVWDDGGLKPFRLA